VEENGCNEVWKQLVWTPIFRHLSDNYLMTFQPCNCLQQKTHKYFLSKMFMKTWHLSHFYYAFDTLKLKSFYFLWQQFHKLWQLVLELCTFHTAGANKCTWIDSLSELVIGRLRLLNSDNDNLPSTKLHGNTLPNI
jgi:hypothetical protein